MRYFRCWRTAAHGGCRVVKNASLAAKTSARLAAVQLLYRDALTGGKTPPEVLVTEYRAWLSEGESARKEAHFPSTAPEPALLKNLLTGVKEHREALVATLQRFIRDDWTPERMGPLMMHLLLTATYELDAKRNRATPVLVDEYATLANRLLGEEESAYVHAALHRLADFLRA